MAVPLCPSIHFFVRNRRPFNAQANVSQCVDAGADSLHGACFL